MGYSHRCTDRTTYWSRALTKCVKCSFKPGYEITPNCGLDDDGGRHDVPHTPCKAGTFNDGSGAYCQPCTTCRPGFEAVTPCSVTSDTQCKVVRSPTTTVSVTENRFTSLPASTEMEPPPKLPSFKSSLVHKRVSSMQFQYIQEKRDNSTADISKTCKGTPNHLTDSLTCMDEIAMQIQTNQGSTSDATTIQTTALLHPAGSHVLWAVPLAIVIFIMLVLLSACVYMKRKKGQRTVLRYNRRSSFINAGFSSLPASSGNNDLEDVLNSAILSAPLQSVLDNLDVLEELVILLDPESHGVKNTKHLASHCSFPSTWITYTYSMRDCKSPLKAVLEGLTSRHPDWTVGHLAKLLRQMERNDAISVLAKLRQDEMVL